MEENVYGWKYKWLQIIKEEFGFVTPISYGLSIEDLKKIFPNCETISDFQNVERSDFFSQFISNIEDSENGYIVRSSSPLEWFNEDFLELSGVYKSVVKKSKDDLFEGIKEVLLYNFSEHITFIHSKNKYTLWVYIPLIIQPLIRWDIAGVLVSERDIFHIEYSQWYNFWITDGTWSKIKELDYSKVKWVTLSWMYDRALAVLIEKSKLISKVYQDFIVEFSIRDGEVIFFQFKDIQKFSFLKDYSVMYMNIIRLMAELWFWVDDFAVEENDTFLFYNYLWIRQTRDEELQHIRILIHENKFRKFIYVREGSTNYIHPSDEFSQSVISKLFETTGLKIIFFINEYETCFMKKDFVYDNRVQSLIFFLDRDIGCYENLIQNKYEIQFFLNRLNKNNYQSTLQTFKTKYENYRLIIESWNISGEVLRILKRISRLYAAYLHIMVRSKDFVTGNILGSSESIVWKVLYSKEIRSTFTCICDISNMKNLRKDNKKVAFICEDFEPSRIIYLETIDLVITKRPFRLSHGVVICKEYGVPLIYGVKWWEGITEWQLIDVDFTLWTIKKIF